MGRKTAAEEAKAIHVSFGQWLEKQIDVSSLDDKEVAQRAGIHPGHFSRMINGKTGTTPETVKAIAKVLNLDVSEALNKAGFGHPESQPAQNPIGEQLLRHFQGLPPDRQKDLLLLAEALWRKHGPTAKARTHEAEDDMKEVMES